MSTKEKIINTIQSYLKVEEEMKVLQKELKERRQKKKDYTELLIDIMKNNEIDCFDLSEGKIIYSQNKIKSTLNKKHILNCLEKYFQNNPNIDTEDVTNFVLDNRTETIKESIRHKPNKK
tara:strand:- start:662 stop:1021 length:360 start_codon:yes stop_codon:yes gene_type:complete